MHIVQQVQNKVNTLAEADKEHNKTSPKVKWGEKQINLTIEAKRHRIAHDIEKNRRLNHWE